MDEHFQMLDEVIEESESTEDYSVSSLAQRTKLDSMRQENFLDISEDTLIKEHLRLKGYLNVLNQINRQSELYELMVFYTSRKSDTKIFDDLAITEITFVNNLRKNLFEIADVVVDSCAPLVDASVPLKNHFDKVGPVSTLAFVTLVWMTVTTVAEILADRGVKLYIHPSHNVPGDTTAQDRLDECLRVYKERVSCL